MAQALKSALPSHLKPSSLSPNDNGEFARKHHGKTQSHMVCAVLPWNINFHRLFRDGSPAKDHESSSFKVTEVRIFWSKQTKRQHARYNTSNGAVAFTHIMAGDEFLYHPVDVGNYEVFSWFKSRVCIYLEFACMSQPTRKGQCFSIITVLDQTSNTTRHSI